MLTRLKRFFSRPAALPPPVPVLTPKGTVPATLAIDWPTFLELLDVAGGIDRMRAAGFSHRDVRQAFHRWRKNRGWLDWNIERMIERSFGLPVTPRPEKGGDDGAAAD